MTVDGMNDFHEKAKIVILLSNTQKSYKTILEDFSVMPKF